jgi:hypothetical protein
MNLECHVNIIMLKHKNNKRLGILTFILIELKNACENQM